jgi:hypothetical protein
MTQPHKKPFWYRFLLPIHDTPYSIAPPDEKNIIPEIKILTENDLKIETILMEEFKYRGETLKQIASDITSTYNLYFIFIGVSISGLGVIYQLAGETHNNLQTVEIVTLLFLGIASFFFLLRFRTLMRSRWRDRVCMDIIRAYYIKHLQGQIPDISHVFRVSMDSVINYSYSTTLFSTFAVIGSLCFGGAAFIITESLIGINSKSLLSLPSDPLPYIIGLLVVGVVLFSQFLILRLTLLRYFNKLQEEREKALVTK